jgi:hypothetical protein
MDSWHIHEGLAAKENLCFLICAMALTSTLDGEERALDLGTLRGVARQLGLKKRGQRQEQLDIMQVFDKLKIPFVIFGPFNDGDLTGELLAPVDHARFVVQRHNPAIPLPWALDAMVQSRVQRAHFVIGASFDGNITAHGAYSGHFRLTLEPEEACVAIYRSKHQTEPSTVASPPPTGDFPPPNLVTTTQNPSTQRETTKDLPQLPPESGLRTDQHSTCAFVEAPHDELEAFLQHVAVGDRIAVPWMERAAPAEGAHVWTGTVISAWEERSRAIVVTWDRGLPKLARGRSRRYMLPQANLPDAAIMYGAPSKLHPPSHTEEANVTEPKPITHGAIRKLLRTAPRHAMIYVRYAQGLEVLQAVGQLQDRAKTDPAQLDILVEKCSCCHLWKNSDDLVVRFPEDNAVYFEASLWETPTPEHKCTCTADGLILEESSDDDAPNGCTESDDEHEVSPNTDAAATLHDPFEEERTGILPAHAPDNSPAIKAVTARKWFIHKMRPPHVHCLVWRQVATSTRVQHIRWLEILRGMPSELHHLPLGTAAIDVIQSMARKRRWKWSTISTALSAVASAVKALPLYTNCLHGTDLTKDPGYAAAMKRAQRNARISSTETAIGANALPYKNFLDLCERTKNPRVRLLLQLCWRFASRVGDMRQVRASDVALQPSKDNTKVNAKVTFCFGKGAAFWGPYTVHTTISKDMAKQLQELRKQRPTAALFTPSDQASLSKLFAADTHEMESTRYGLRSIRKGSLQWLASLGVTEENLKLLSGHRRTDTLLRYLGWGRFSAASASAALERDRLEDKVTGSGVDPPDFIEGPKMGLYSGHYGHRGRRIDRPLSSEKTFIPKKAPSRKDLGLESNIDTSDYKLHVKPGLSTVEWDKITALALGTPFEEEINLARKWATTDELFGKTRLHHNHEIPYARFTSEEVAQLLQAGKIEPHEGPILGYAKAFCVLQHRKKRKRPIFEPSLNQQIDRANLPHQRYPSRFQRRAAARGMKFSMDFDCSAYFDQFEIPENLRSHFVIKTKNSEGRAQLFRLTRMPMGACHAPGVAQCVTWVLTYPLTGLRNVRVDTMIDNIRIMASDRVDFLRAVRNFLERARRAGIVLNKIDSLDIDPQQLTDQQILNIGQQNYIFLGEHYNTVEQTVRNSDDSVSKLSAALERFRRCALSNNKCQDPITVRHLTSLIGLTLFMAHTINIDLAQHHGFLRSYSLLVKRGLTSTSTTQTTSSWDQPLDYLSPTLSRDLYRIADPLIANQPVPLPTLRSPNERYDIVCIVDASKTGWGAYVFDHTKNSAYSLRQSWTHGMEFSARAEPRAVQRLMNHLNNTLNTKSQLTIAIVTDHQAIPNGQRRWYSNNGGFSTAWELNSAFTELYRHPAWHIELFYVPGELNIADPLSRHPETSYELRQEYVSDILFPSMDNFQHPYDTDHRPDRYV